jgi:hypothetical protein
LKKSQSQNIIFLKNDKVTQKKAGRPLTSKDRARKVGVEAYANLIC